MSVEGGGVLIALFGLPFILAVAVAYIAAKILVVTAAGTVVTTAALARGAGNAAKALAQTGYRVYQEHQDATARAQQDAPNTNTVSTDNYASVRASVRARKQVEARLKKMSQRAPEFTPQDRAALATQMTLVTAKTAEIQRKPATTWHVPVLPQTVINPQQPTIDGTVSEFDFKSAFNKYRDVLTHLQQQMHELAPKHALTAEIDELVQDAATAEFDAEKITSFISDVLIVHSEAATTLQMVQQQVAHRVKVMTQVKATLERVDDAQQNGVELSPNLRMYMQELQQVLKTDDFDQIETLLTRIDKELQSDARHHMDLLQSSLQTFFADMLRDMQHFGAMVLIDEIHASSPAEVKDKQRRAECIAWVEAYHKFMDDVAHGRIGDVVAERDLLEAQANHLRDVSINMAEEVHHGYIAGLFRIALNEVGFPPASDQPVRIYGPIVGYSGNKSVTFQLREDGTFEFSSDGFGDAECKVIYDQVLAKLREYGMRIAETHRWKQAEAVNKILAALVKMGYRVDFAERNAHIDITATKATGEPVSVSVDADGSHGALPAGITPMSQSNQRKKQTTSTSIAERERLRE